MRVVEKRIYQGGAGPYCTFLQEGFLTMSDYTTPRTEKQEGTCGKTHKKQQKATSYNWRQRRDSDFRALRAAQGVEHPLTPVAAGLYMDPHTGEAVPALHDEQYDWRRKKQKTIAVADLYRAGHDDQYADRAMSCATWLQYLANLDGDKRTLRAFNACHLRLCPLCSNRRARLMTARLIRILTAVKAEHPTATLLFLTLTVKNCKADELRDTLTLLTAAWTKLAKRRPFMRAVKGWFRAIEITRNQSDGTYHPHIHAILVVEPDYFKRSGGLYIFQGVGAQVPPDGYKIPSWVDMWRQCLQADYQPIVGISRAKGKAGEQRDTNAASLNAAMEAAKYATKDAEYINGKIPEAERADVLRTYTDALRGKRLVALGGWMADAAAGVDLEDDGDLVHADDDSGGDLTAATAEMLEVYGWHFGVSNHVLKDKTPNPDYQGPGKNGGNDDD